MAKRTLHKLSAVGVARLKAPGRHSDGGGLYLSIDNQGRRRWVFMYVRHGKRCELGLGSGRDMPLAIARTEAAALRLVLERGGDPKAERVHAEGAPTFRKAAECVHDETKGSWRNLKHSAQWLTSLEAYAFPDIGDVPVSDVTAPAVRDLLLKIWLEKPETARRVRQRIGAVLDWAHAKGYRDQEAPMRSISKGLPRQPRKDQHFAAMPYEDVPDFMAQLAASDTVGRQAVRFAILTAARSGEVRGARWSEIDLEAKTWTIPAARMKAGKVHVVPLSGMAVEVLKVMQSRKGGGLDDANDHPHRESIIFPGNEGKPLSDMTLTKVLRDAGIKDFTVHGFRSSFRDWAAEQTTIVGEIVEAALAHAISNRVEAAYRRTNYLEKRRGLMEAWARYLAKAPAGVSNIADARKAAG